MLRLYKHNLGMWEECRLQTLRSGIHYYDWWAIFGQFPRVAIDLAPSEQPRIIAGSAAVRERRNLLCFLAVRAAQTEHDY